MPSKVDLFREKVALERENAELRDFAKALYGALVLHIESDYGVGWRAYGTPEMKAMEARARALGLEVNGG